MDGMKIFTVREQEKCILLNYSFVVEDMYSR